MMPSGFAQTNLRAIGFRREIPLLDRPTVVLPQICRQTLHQKFAFDLARNFPVVGESTPHHFPLCSNACTAGKPQCFSRGDHQTFTVEYGIPSLSSRAKRGTSQLVIAHTTLKRLITCEIPRRPCGSG